MPLAVVKADTAVEGDAAGTDDHGGAQEGARQPALAVEGEEGTLRIGLGPRIVAPLHRQRIDRRRTGDRLVVAKIERRDRADMDETLDTGREAAFGDIPRAADQGAFDILPAAAAAAMREVHHLARAAHDSENVLAPRNVAGKQPDARIIVDRRQVAQAARHDGDALAVAQETGDEVRPDEAGAAEHRHVEDAIRRFGLPKPPLGRRPMRLLSDAHAMHYDTASGATVVAT